MRRNAKGQQTKNTARLKRFEELNDSEYQKRNETAEIFIPVAERLGNEVIEFDTGHWVMSNAPQRFNQVVNAWLAR